MSHLQRTLLLVAVVLLVTAQAAFAQRGRDTWSGDQSAVEIAGQVRVSGETRGARNISVRLERFGGGIVDQMMTDDIGKFRFQGLPRGIYVIVISADGYNSAQQQVDLQVILRGYVVFDLVPAQRAAELPAMILDARVPLEAQKEFELGRAALAIKDTKVALAHLEKATTLYADFYEAQLLLGTTYINERRWKDAEAALKNALRAKPGSTAALFALGELYRREKRYAEAEKVLEEGLVSGRRRMAGLFHFGASLLGEGRRATRRAQGRACASAQTRFRGSAPPRGQHTATPKRTRARSY